MRKEGGAAAVTRPLSPERASGKATCSPHTQARRQLLWWRSCLQHQPPRAQGWWPQSGMQGRWAAARQEGWPPPPSEALRRPGFLLQRSSLQSPWLSSQPGEIGTGSHLDLSRNEQGYVTLRDSPTLHQQSGDSSSKEQLKLEGLLNSPSCPQESAIFAMCLPFGFF